MVFRSFKAQTTIKQLRKFAKIVGLKEIDPGNKIILSKIGLGNELQKFLKIEVAEEIGWENVIILIKIGQRNGLIKFAKIGQGYEIIMSKIGQGNELWKLWLGKYKLKIAETNIYHYFI